MSREYTLMRTFIAGEDFTDGKPDGDTNRLGDLYKLVKMKSDGTVIKCAAATDDTIGVLHYTGKKGDHVQVAIGGYSLVQVRANAAANAGTFFGPHTDGRATSVAKGAAGVVTAIAGQFVEAVTTNDAGAAVGAIINPQIRDAIA